MPGGVFEITVQILCKIPEYLTYLKPFLKGVSIPFLALNTAYHKKCIYYMAECDVPSLLISIVNIIVIDVTIQCLGTVTEFDQKVKM